MVAASWVTLQTTNQNASFVRKIGGLPTGQYWWFVDVYQNRLFIVDELEHRSDKLAYVKATIYVEKESQKGIIIGAGGQMLKKIGTMARMEIERWLGKKVYLDLWVKVAKNWRKDENALRRFGYAVRR
jgi:hypothetical protein